MSQCADLADVAKAVDSPTGAGNDTTARANPYDQGSSERVLEQAREGEQRTILEQAAMALGTDAAPAVTQPTIKDTKSALSISRDVVGTYEKAVARSGERMQELEHDTSIALGTDVGTITMWNNLQNKAYRWFVNQRGDFHKYIYRFARVLGLQNYENPIVRTFDQNQRLIAGQSSIFKRAIDAFDREVAKAAIKTSHTQEELSGIIGEYSSARSAPGENALLIRRWKEMAVANRERAEEFMRSDNTAEAGSRLREAKALEIRAQRLEENLESLTYEKPLISSGFTNAEARAVMESKLRESGLTPEQMTYFSDKLAELFGFIREERAAKGSLAPEVVASFPPELADYHVPMLSRTEGNTGATNDASIFNPGHYHAAEGRSSRPDDAYSLLSFYAGRAATEIGTQRLGLQIAALEKSFIERYGMDAWDKLPQAEREKLEKLHKNADLRYARNVAREQFGLTSIAERDLMGRLNSPEQWVRKQAENIYNVGGIMVDVPSRAPDGTISTERRLYWFDSNWRDAESGLNGPALNEALSSNYKLGTFAEGLTKATGFYGQTYTHFSLGFAPVSGTRDVLERAFHMTSRDYLDASGNAIGGQKLVAKFFTNVAKSPMTLFKALRGTLDADSKGAQYWKEYNDNGLNQQFSPGKRQPSAEDLLDRKQGIVQKWIDQPQAKWVRQYANRMGATGKLMLRALDTWNDYFQNISSFAHYTTLRDAGVTPRDASQYVLDMMNMTQQGSITQYIGALSPFVRPTTQSALAIARTFGLGANSPKDILKAGKRGWITGLGTFMAYTMLAPVIRESLGYDENGDSYADAMSISQLTSSLPIGLGDGRYIKGPAGFGPQRIAAAFAWGLDKMNRGLMSPSDVAYEVLFAAGRDIAPGNWPQYSFKDHPGEFVMNMICPAPLTPFLQLNENLSFFGAPIHNEGKSDKLKSDQGKTTTPRFWHQAARLMHDTLGMDVYPESIQYTARGLTLGPANVIKSLLVGFADDDQIRKNGAVPTAFEEMGPVMQALGGALWYGKQRSAVVPMYYNGKDELTKMVKESRVNLTDHPKSLKGQELLDWKRQQLIEKSDMSQKDIDDYIALLDTDTQLRQLGRALNEEYKDRWMDGEDSQELKDAFDEHFAQTEALYSAWNKKRYGDRQ